LKTNFNDIDELLVKFLAGEATAAEKEHVQQWMQQDEKNRQYYDHFRLIWEESLQLAATTPIDENAAWQRFQQRTEQTPTTSAGRVRALPARLARIAAILIIAAGLGWMAWYLLGDDTAEPTPLATLQTTNDVKSDTLPDGSTITINKNSSVTWPQQFTGKQRNVQLTGEGFFSVTPDKQKPFIVQAGNNIIIEVLGTSFNIKSRDDSTEVIVETGHVQVSWNLEKVSLQAGEKVVIKYNGDSVQKQAVTDRLYNYYRSRVIHCDNTPLSKLVPVLNEAYSVNIVFGRPGLREVSLNTTFNNLPLDSVLAVIQETLEVTVVKQNDSIILR
jgi:transmembrane sensor